MAEIFFETRFLLLILFSLLLPAAIFGWLIVKRKISRITVMLFGLILIGLAGVDIVLLQSLASSAKASLSPLDDAIFASEISLGLYLLPAVCAGIGINVVSHVLINHLVEAEQRFDQEREFKRSDAAKR